MTRDIITAERLRELLHYDLNTGLFTRLTRVAHRVHIGDVARWSGMYCRIRIDRHSYLAHRLAWLYQTGVWPTYQIDHINMDKNDNSWCNLRQATRSQNHMNTGTLANTISGFKGVSWNKQVCRWMARIQVGGKRGRLGYFDQPHLAYIAYCRAARKHFGEFARLYDDDVMIIPRKVFEERVLRNLLAATQSQLMEAA